MRNKESLREWLDIASDDLEASHLLYKHKLYPQSLYFMHQSTEKLGKAIAIALKYTKSGKELSHNLRANVYIDTENRFLEKLKAAVPGLKTASSKDLAIWKEVDAFLGSSEGKEVKHLLERYLVLKHFDYSKKPGYLEKELSRINKQEEKIKEQLNSIKVSFRKCPDRFDKITNEDKKNVIDTFQMIKDYKLEKIDYSLAVLYFLSNILPDQQSFRYPEFNPSKTYTENYILVRNYSKVYGHLKGAIKTFYSIYQDNPFFALYDP